VLPFSFSKGPGATNIIGGVQGDYNDHSTTTTNDNPGGSSQTMNTQTGPVTTTSKSALEWAEKIV
jgi:hypothetical protein